jgi:hypothetical protein
MIDLRDEYKSLAMNVWNFRQVCVNLARRNNGAWRNCGKTGVIHW